MKLTPEQRFWSKVRKTRGCWLWIGSQNEDGYGTFRLNGKIRKAHRVVWFLTTGHWPSHNALHTCDTPACVRFKHLYDGTQKDNARDRSTRGRHWQQKKTHCPRGHEFTNSNTYLQPHHGRQCRICQRAAVVRYRRKKHGLLRSNL